MAKNDGIVNQPVIKKSIKFLEKSFKENPHYSFNDWTIMYEHSIAVMKNALVLAENHPQVDKIVIAIAGLFHDIGKTVKADEKTLRVKHEELGYEVTRDFLQTTNLTQIQYKKIQELFKLDNKNLEKQIIKDADYLNFYQNARLYKAYKKWADENNLQAELERKLKRFEKLSDHAKQIAKPYFENMKKDWEIKS